jgi:hypothetical protein
MTSNELLMGLEYAWELQRNVKGIFHGPYQHYDIWPAICSKYDAKV